MNNKFTAFLQLQKVDVAKREVWGFAAVEQPDRAREIMDFEKSLPNFVKWSQDMEEASGGLSKGNVRAMHRDVAAGKVIHFEPREDTKSFYVGTKIVDDNEWQKVLEGVYTGFSVGGSYGAKWEDPMLKGYTRYEAKPIEISLVDTPCMPGATFEVIKADGARELAKLRTVDAGDLEKGDFEGHPFRGNQYTGGVSEGENYDPKMKHALEFADSDTVASAAEILEAQGHSVYTHGNKLRFETPEDQNEAADILGAKGMRGLDGQRADWDSEVKRGIDGVSLWSKKERTGKIKELSRKSDSWTGMSLDTVRGERKRYTQMLFSRFGEEQVKRGNYPEKFKAYEKDMDAWEKVLVSARYLKAGKSLGVSELLKEVNMKPNELLEKLATSTDPAMQDLADELKKAFPPAKKKDEESEETEADDKNSKPNPFAKEGEENEPDGDEGDNPEAASDGDGDESKEAEEQPAGTPSPEKTESIRAVVIQLLEELGFVQEQGGQPGAPAVVKFATATDLQKMLPDQSQLTKRFDTYEIRQKEMTDDLAKLYTAVREMEKRGGPAPVLRELGNLSATSAADLQKAAILQEMIEKASDPTVKQSLQLQLTELEIKKVQKQS